MELETAARRCGKQDRSLTMTLLADVVTDVGNDVSKANRHSMTVCNAVPIGRLRITAVTVDTSIFDQKRLQLNSATMQSFSALKGKPFSFVLSSTVAKEVLSHLEKAANEALTTAKKGIGQALFSFETDAPTRDQLLEQISGGRTAVQASKQRWEKYIDDSGCEVLIDTDLVCQRQSKSEPKGSAKCCHFGVGMTAA